MVLERIIARFLGEDRTKAIKMVGLSHSVKKAPGHVWIDYLFLAACYAHQAGDQLAERNAIRQIREGFPNYDPSERFNWEFMQEVSLEDIKKDNSKSEKMGYKVPVVGHMNLFCEKHPDFSFEEAFGEYFPGVKKMRIRGDSGSSK